MRRMTTPSWLRTLGVIQLCLTLSACATTVPYVGRGPHPQITRGRPLPPIDLLGNLLSLPQKLLFLNWRLENHAISEQTEAALVRYLDAHHEALGGLSVRLNSWDPGDDLARLATNEAVAWPYRLLLGLPTTLVHEIILAGRLFGGDHYNPFTDVVHLYSDHEAIALHEAGHARDFASQRRKGTYALLRLFPFVDLLQEHAATEEAIAFFRETGDTTAELRAYRMLYPAFGSYVGKYVSIPYSYFVLVAGGHLFGWRKARSQQRVYEQLQRFDATYGTAAPAAPPVTASPAPPPLGPAAPPTTPGAP